MFSLILDKKEKWGREREREKHQLVASCTCPNQGSNPQPRYVLWWRTEPTTFWCMGWCSNQLGHPARAVILLNFHHSHVICEKVVLLLPFQCIYLFFHFFTLLCLFALLHWLGPTVQSWTEMVILDILSCFQSQGESTLAVSFSCVHIRFRKLPFIPCLLMNFLKSISCKADLMAFDSLSFCLLKNVFILLSFFKEYIHWVYIHHRRAVFCFQYFRDAILLSFGFYGFC